MPSYTRCCVNASTTVGSSPDTSTLQRLNTCPHIKKSDASGIKHPYRDYQSTKARPKWHGRDLREEVHHNGALSYSPCTLTVVNQRPLGQLIHRLSGHTYANAPLLPTRLVSFIESIPHSATLTGHEVNSGVQCAAGCRSLCIFFA